MYPFIHFKNCTMMPSTLRVSELAHAQPDGCLDEPKSDHGSSIGVRCYERPSGDALVTQNHPGDCGTALEQIALTEQDGEVFPVSNVHEEEIPGTGVGVPAEYLGDVTALGFEGDGVGVGVDVVASVLM